MAAVPEELEHDLESAYRAHFPLLYRRARRWLPPDEAEDLVQETFLRAWAHHAGSNPGVPWLLTVLRNLAIDRSRKKAPVLVDDIASFETPTLEDASDNVVRLEEERRVRTAISALTDAQQQVLRLREWGGMSQQEIADSLGTTVPSVESLLQRGRRQLRKALDHAMGFVLLPATGFWRKLRGLEASVASTHPVPALTAAVANIATAATVIVAGAAAPLIAAQDPEARVPAVVREDRAPATQTVPVVMEPKQIAGKTPLTPADASSPSAQASGSASGEQAGHGGTDGATPSDGSVAGGSGSLGTGGSVDTSAPPPATGGEKTDPPPIGHGSDENPTSPGNAPPSSDEPPAETPAIGENDLPSVGGTSVSADLDASA